MSATIGVREVLPRDGFQDLEFHLSADVKVAVIEQLWLAGLRWIEVTSMVHPRWVPQFTDAEEVLTRTRTLEGVKAAVFVPNRKGLERALTIGVDEISLAVAATDTLSETNFRMDRKTAMAEIMATAAAAFAAGIDVSVTIGGAFGCPYEGEVATQQVVDLAGEIVDHGIGVVLLADTIGSARPEAVAKLFDATLARFPFLTLGAHFHGGAGALNNVRSSVRHGARVVDSSLGGLGGCPFVPDAPGNVPTEVVTDWLHEMGLTDLDPGQVSAAALAVNSILQEARSHAPTP